MPHQSEKKGLEGLRNHPRIDLTPKLEPRARVVGVGQRLRLLPEAGAGEHPAGESCAEEASGRTSQTTRSKPRELRELEEATGEFRGYTVDGKRILVMLRNSCSIVLPQSAQQALKLLSVGQRIAILRISENCIKVRQT